MPKKRSKTLESVGPRGDSKVITRANINREAVESPVFVALYANDTQIQITPWDFRFVFGVIKSAPTVENPTISISTLGEVRMSPQHAKKVLAVLERQVAIYEQNVGPIPLPSD
jgi:hypothetical protein